MGRPARNIARLDAIAAGRDTYFDGSPCLNGHVSIRKVKNHRCVECQRIASARHRGRGLVKESTKAAGRFRACAWAKANPRRHAERGAKWRAENPVAMRAILQRRRSREANAEGSHTADDIRRIFSDQCGRCVGCSEQMGILSMTIDHIIPLSRGGSNYTENIQLLCRPCNSSKGTRTMAEWITFKQRQPLIGA